MRDFFLNNVNKKLANREIPRVDLHMHTTWTDGDNTLDEMHKVAIEKKIEHIFFSEHSRKASGDWFQKFVKETKKLDQSQCKAYAGTEVKILDLNGNLDLSNEIEASSEFIMASVHRFPGEKGNIFENKNNFDPNDAVKIEYELTLAAIENPKTTIIGHPFGMSLKRFNISPSQKLFIDIIEKCKKFEKVFEVNSNYHNNINYLVEECLKKDTLISLGSNAHNIKDVGKILQILDK